MRQSGLSKYLSVGYWKRRALGRTNDHRTENPLALEKRPDQSLSVLVRSKSVGEVQEVTIHIHINYSPQVTIQGKASLDDAAAILGLLTQQREEFGRMVEEVLDQKLRERNLGF
jgi:hypothetical protein